MDSFTLYLVETGEAFIYPRLKDAEAERPMFVSDLASPHDYWVIYEPGNPDPIRHYGLKDIILEGVEKNFYLSPPDGSLELDLGCGINKRITADRVSQRIWSYNGKKLGKADLIQEIAAHVAEQYAAEFKAKHPLTYSVGLSSVQDNAPSPQALAKALGDGPLNVQRMDAEQIIKTLEAAAKEIEGENKEITGPHAMKGKLYTAGTNIRCAVAMLRDYKQQSS